MKIIWGLGSGLAIISVKDGVIRDNCSTSISHAIAFGPKDQNTKQHAGSGLAIIISLRSPK